MSKFYSNSFKLLSRQYLSPICRRGIDGLNKETLSHTNRERCSPSATTIYINRTHKNLINWIPTKQLTPIHQGCRIQGEIRCINGNIASKWDYAAHQVIARVNNIGDNITGSTTLRIIQTADKSVRRCSPHIFNEKTGSGGQCHVASPSSWHNRARLINCPVIRGSSPSKDLRPVYKVRTRQKVGKLVSISVIQRIANQVIARNNRDINIADDVL